MKTDPISILVYIIIGIILYYCIGIITKVCYLYLCIPPFSYYRQYAYDSNPVMILPNILWSILYAVPVIVAISCVFAILLFFILLMYIIWKVLQMIPIFGFIIINTVPPFKQFEEAGIFKLIDDIGATIVKWLPKSVVKMFGRLFLVIVKFTKDKIIDIAKAIKPDLELKPGEIDAILEKEAFVNKEEHFINKDEAEKEAKNLHKLQSLEAIDQKILAERYKSLTSITPDMGEQDRMSIIFNNEFKKIQVQLNNTSDNIKIEMATLPGS